VVIVNQAFTRRYFPDVDPLGRFIRSGDEPYAEVVGVVADTKFVSLAEAPQPLVYYSYARVRQLPASAPRNARRSDRVAQTDLSLAELQCVRIQGSGSDPGLTPATNLGLDYPPHWGQTQV
jgi:hypothetical protein